MINREKYLSVIRDFYESDLVKVITGIRRCGKSVILNTIITEISKKTDNIIYLNFENMNDFSKASTYLDLLTYVKAKRKAGKCYIFLDEIQEVDEWQKAIKDLRLGDNSVFITGSNSKLLSSEFLTLLSGRFVSFRIRPFVYQEIIEYGKELNKDISVSDYLTWGGFPGRFQIDTEQGRKNYLTDIENTIVINDLIKRYKIKKEVLFKRVVNFVLENNARIFSARSVYNYIKKEYDGCSINTIIKYIDYLKEAFIIDEIPQYSTKKKRDLVFLGKIYLSDVCFNSLRAFNGRFDYDHNLENIVYNELLYRGYELKVFDNNGKEIDFVASKNGKLFFVQVAYSVADPKAYDREFGAFSSLDNNNQKILITTDEPNFSTSTIRHISLKDFLLMNDF